jgi:hypothetical protein
MALNKSTLETAIKAAFQTEQTEEGDANTSLDNIASKLATAIDAFVRTATVTVAAGIPVSTAGSAAAQTGATTGPGTGTVS